MRIGHISGLGFSAYGAYAASSSAFAAGNAAGVDEAALSGAGVGTLAAGKGESAKAGAAYGTGGENDTKVKAGYRSSPAECETCRTRKYQDGSDENVSFKSASHISPNQAGAAVRAHEGEHVANAYKKAAEEGGRVVQAGVSIEMSVCPECGRSYVSGGLTRTTIAQPRDDGKENPYTKNLRGLLNQTNGSNADFSV